MIPGFAASVSVVFIVASHSQMQKFAAWQFPFEKAMRRIGTSLWQQQIIRSPDAFRLLRIKAR